MATAKNSMLVSCDYLSSIKHCTCGASARTCHAPIVLYLAALSMPTGFQPFLDTLNHLRRAGINNLIAIPAYVTGVRGSFVSNFARLVEKNARTLRTLASWVNSCCASCW